VPLIGRSFPTPALNFFQHLQIYDVLNIKGLQERGESFYNPLLRGVIDELEKQELAVESDGAKVVYLEGVS
jgi:arginyl-tRNA synthetase